jgi:hypothetical protein
MTADNAAQPAWLNAALEEYKAHRTAFSETRASAQQTLTFGATTVGILVAGAFNVWGDRLPATLLFLVVTPIVASVVIVQWTGLMLALWESDLYLGELETAIRAAYDPIPPALFTWEDNFFARFRVKGKWWKPDRRWQMNAAITAFPLLAAGSLILGAYRGWQSHPVAVSIVGTIEFAVLAFVAIALLRQLGSAAKQPASGPPSCGQHDELPKGEGCHELE